MYEATDEQLTLNGIHLNANGYRKLADVIAGPIGRRICEHGRFTFDDLQGSRGQKLALAQFDTARRMETIFGARVRYSALSTVKRTPTCWFTN